MHVHVRRAGGFAKFWLEPICLDYSQGMSPESYPGLNRSSRRTWTNSEEVG